MVRETASPFHGPDIEVTAITIIQACIYTRWTARSITVEAHGRYRIKLCLTWRPRNPRKMSPPAAGPVVHITAIFRESSTWEVSCRHLKRASGGSCMISWHTDQPTVSFPTRPFRGRTAVVATCISHCYHSAVTSSSASVISCKFFTFRVACR